MSHWVTQTVFNYYVSKMSGIRSEVCLRNPNIEGAFNSEKQAIKFAMSLHDGLNFIMIYNEFGKAIHAFGPKYKHD